MGNDFEVHCKEFRDNGRCPSRGTRCSGFIIIFARALHSEAAGRALCEPLRSDGRRGL